MKLYFECNSGISGDMTVAALLDLGADREQLEQGLRSLHLPGYHLHIGRASKCGVDACDFDVHLEDGAHEHSCAHEHPHDQSHPHDHDHPHDYSHPHEPGHSHEHSHSHAHRGMPEIREIIGHSGISEGAKRLALQIFEALALAESKAHNLPVDEVHFHEVGAVDSIVDIVGTAICIDSLKPESVRFSPLSEGVGSVRCQHGVIPVPVPAVVNLAADRGIPMKITDISGEMVTPTGAAIAGVLADGWGAPENWQIKKIGIGAGKKDFPHANILRVFAYEDARMGGADVTSKPEAQIGGVDTVCQLEANIDDQTGESLAYAMDKLVEAGALDCWFTPVIMKKSRPAVTLGVICRKEDKERIAGVMLAHTSTIGIRVTQMERFVCSREPMKVMTRWGEALAKRSVYGDQIRVTAEFESAKAIADSQGRPIQQVMEEIVRVAVEG